MLIYNKQYSLSPEWDSSSSIQLYIRIYNYASRIFDLDGADVWFGGWSFRIIVFEKVDKITEQLDYAPHMEWDQTWPFE